MATAIPLEPFVVRVVFSDGEEGDGDIEPILDGPVFRAGGVRATGWRTLPARVR